MKKPFIEKYEANKKKYQILIMNQKKNLKNKILIKEQKKKVKKKLIKPKLKRRNPKKNNSNTCYCKFIVFKYIILKGLIFIFLELKIIYNLLVL